MSNRVISSGESHTREHGDWGDAQAQPVPGWLAVLTGISTSYAALAVVAGVGGLLVLTGIASSPTTVGSRRILAVAAALTLLFAEAVGAWAATGRTRPRGSLLVGGVIPILVVASGVLVAWPFVAPIADFRSVAIALDWIDAPNLGTGPSEALHRFVEGQMEAGMDGNWTDEVVSNARANARNTISFLGILLATLILAGVLGATLNRRPARGVGRLLEARGAAVALAALAIGVIILTRVLWGSVWSIAGAVVDFDQSAGSEIGVVLTEVVGHPEAMWGETVTVSAAVDRIVGPHAAVIGNDAPLVGSTLLIVSEEPLRDQILLPDLTRGNLEAGDVIQVTGTVRQRDPAAVPQDVGALLNEVRASQFEGQTVLVVDAIDLDVPVAAEAGDPELGNGSAGYDPGVTINDIVYHPEAHVGLTVTVSGEIEEPILTPHVFVLEGRALLVISPRPRQELFVEATAYVTGEVRIFDVAEVEGEIGVDLDDDALAPYEGQPFILADAIEVVT